ncbi:All-trans-zeta-carotene desaturase [Gemmata obscuriglobus]|uniref:Phytoene desaturase n=1 Tax=Gemmata obscuriglobus TaxID=114 RepID=A0A2Z3HBM9_9BACT|nr:phytoene desaturase family protein [Gemmata obscuriglobus]AWM39054.1 phytoene desaturase [Gemmata obscuriglobus]QEG27912.1 All-trans-zeta-carotene desaturase [Gemmata obscuriglobus]VTS05350.1 phytoene desaturase : Phytoene desaturase OS=Candidatus Entotheonella sp. TSY1 GN=ETSY1_19775 PE=4 SV=1: Amino_oxidase [Gemmata obscuriglobus UQM 2246]
MTAPSVATLSPAPHAAKTGRRKSVLIVGAGPGGLAAALLLAKAGLDVHVVERLPHVGGRCSALEAEGFRFDLGPTFFLYPKVLERIFKLIGRDLLTEIPMVRLDPQYRISFGGGGQLDCTPDVAKLEAEVAKISPQDAPHVRRFLADNRHKMELFRPCLEQPFSGWTDLVRWQLMRLFPTLRPWASLDSELGRYFGDERVRLAFSFQSKYLGMSPFNCPSLFSILSFLEYEYGVWHPLGGCAAVSDGMARVARECGVRVSLNEEVEEVLFDGRKAVGVRTRTGEHRADALVVNADFAYAMTKLVPNRLRRKWTDAKIEKKKFSCSTFMMYLGVEGRFDHVPHHTIHTSADYLNNLRDIEDRHVLSDDPSFYVQNATPTDPGLAPPGMSTLYVLAPVTHQHPNVDWQKETPAFRAKLFRQLDKVGLPDVERRVRFEKIITPADWENRYNVYRGATFNLAHTWGQMLHLRPQNRFSELGGVYLVGGGTHPGSGLPVIYESARITSRLLLNDLGLDAEWLGVPGAAELPVSAPTA